MRWKLNTSCALQVLLSWTSFKNSHRAQTNIYLLNWSIAKFYNLLIRSKRIIIQTTSTRHVLHRLNVPKVYSTFPTPTEIHRQYSNREFCCEKRRINVVCAFALLAIVVLRMLRFADSVNYDDEVQSLICWHNDRRIKTFIFRLSHLSILTRFTGRCKYVDYLQCSVLHACWQMCVNIHVVGWTVSLLTHRWQYFFGPLKFVNSTRVCMFRSPTAPNITVVSEIRYRVT